MGRGEGSARKAPANHFQDALKGKKLVDIANILFRPKYFPLHSEDHVALKRQEQAQAFLTAIHSVAVTQVPEQRPLTEKQKQAFTDGMTQKKDMFIESIAEAMCGELQRADPMPGYLLRDGHTAPTHSFWSYDTRYPNGDRTIIGRKMHRFDEWELLEGVRPGSRFCDVVNALAMAAGFPRLFQGTEVYTCVKVYLVEEDLTQPRKQLQPSRAHSPVYLTIVDVAPRGTPAPPRVVRYRDDLPQSTMKDVTYEKTAAAVAANPATPMNRKERKAAMPAAEKAAKAAAPAAVAQSEATATRIPSARDGVNADKTSRACMEPTNTVPHGADVTVQPTIMHSADSIGHLTAVPSSQVHASDPVKRDAPDPLAAMDTSLLVNPVGELAQAGPALPAPDAVYQPAGNTAQATALIKYVPWRPWDLDTASTTKTMHSDNASGRAIGTHTTSHQGAGTSQMIESELVLFAALGGSVAAGIREATMLLGADMVYTIRQLVPYGTGSTASMAMLARMAGQPAALTRAASSTGQQRSLCLPAPTFNDYDAIILEWMDPRAPAMATPGVMTAQRKDRPMEWDYHFIKDQPVRQASLDIGLADASSQTWPARLLEQVFSATGAVRAKRWLSRILLWCKGRGNDIDAFAGCPMMGHDAVVLEAAGILGASPPTVERSNHGVAVVARVNPHILQLEGIHETRDDNNKPVMNLTVDNVDGNVDTTRAENASMHPGTKRHGFVSKVCSVVKWGVGHVYRAAGAISGVLCGAAACITPHV